MTIPRQPYTGFDPETEARFTSLRRGTVQRFESPWFLLRGTATESQARDIDHGLGAIPGTVDIQESHGASGTNPNDGNSSVTVTKDKTSIRVTTVLAVDRYFKVVAF